MIGATIGSVKIRAITLGTDLPLDGSLPAAMRQAGAFLSSARAAFEGAGLPVQTTRVAGPGLGPLLSQPGQPAHLRSWAARAEGAARDAGVEFLSLGRVPADQHEVVRQHVADILAAGEIGFLSADLLLDGRPSPAMAAACAHAVRLLAERTPLGFGNLRFAATASCPPNIPFLPAAYHAGGPPRFSVAVQAADVVLAVARGPGTPEEVEERLVGALEDAAAPLEVAARQLEARHGFPYAGVDLSPAPFPTDDVSIAGAVEALGVDAFGVPGTLYAAALVTRALRRTRVRHVGFSGLMLPVLEDSVLARRQAERPTSLHELLLYSAVCGTGLDTVPLPGDVSEAELAGAYLDVSALSVALGGKPLTARFLPVPGALAGEATAFTFDYFHNALVLPAAGGGATGILARAASA